MNEPNGAAESLLIQLATLFGLGVTLVSGGIAYGKLDQKTEAAHSRLDDMAETMSEQAKRNDERHSRLEDKISSELKDIGETVKNIEIAIAHLGAGKQGDNQSSRRGT